MHACTHACTAACMHVPRAAPHLAVLHEAQLVLRRELVERRARVVPERVPPLLVGPAQLSLFDGQTPLRLGYLCQLSATSAFILVLTCAHRFRSRTAFLDIACINQLDAEKKADGINSLGAVLDRSQRMLVLLDENHLSRMW